MVSKQLISCNYKRSSQEVFDEIIIHNFVQRTEKCHSGQDALCPFEHEEIILFVQTTLFQTKQAALEQVVPKKKEKYSCFYINFIFIKLKHH